LKNVEGRSPHSPQSLPRVDAGTHSRLDVDAKRRALRVRSWVFGAPKTTQNGDAASKDRAVEWPGPTATLRGARLEGPHSAVSETHAQAAGAGGQWPRKESFSRATDGSDLAWLEWQAAGPGGVPLCCCAKQRRESC